MVSGNNRVYKVGADSQEDLDKWLQAINRAARVHDDVKKTDVIPEAFKDAIFEQAPEGEVRACATERPQARITRAACAGHLCVH
jgi:hypothetical protein